MRLDRVLPFLLGLACLVTAVAISGCQGSSESSPGTESAGTTTGGGSGGFTGGSPSMEGLIRLTPAWEITDGLSNPESVFYHAPSDQLFVSNVAGGGTDKDGEGWISIISPLGEMISDQWVTGLNGPKGIRATETMLWVSDIDRLIGITIETGEKTHQIDVPGARFLNDVAIDESGNVYVSDMLTSKIHRWDGTQLEEFVSGDEFESPNGLLVVGDQLYVAAWGLTDNFETETPGRLYHIDLESRDQTMITPDPTGNLDGIELLSAADADPLTFVVSDWNAGKLFSIDVNGNVKEILQDSKGTADVAFHRDDRLLLIPQMQANKLMAYKVDML